VLFLDEIGDMPLALQTSISDSGMAAQLMATNLPLRQRLCWCSVRLTYSLPLPVMQLPFTSPREGEKLLRLLNAGIALCIEGETGSGKALTATRRRVGSRRR
jgi:transcriptional regulator of acetoin/glycerol metabolism